MIILQPADIILLILPPDHLFTCSLARLVPHMCTQAAYLLIAVGSLVFIISFLGYCGALQVTLLLSALQTYSLAAQENRVLLTAYGLFITLVFGLQITGIVMIVVYKVRQ
jgi:hypothetical protein